MEEEDLSDSGNNGEIQGNNQGSNFGLEKRKFVKELDLLERQSNGKDKQSNRQGKKKGIIINGSNLTLKLLKPNVDKLGLHQNKAQASLSIGEKNKLSDEQRRNESFEQVTVSEKLYKDSHTAIRFMTKNKAPLNANKENNIFLFGSTGDTSSHTFSSDMVKSSNIPDLQNTINS